MQIVPCDEKQIKVTKRFEQLMRKLVGSRRNGSSCVALQATFVSKIAFGTAAKRLN